ncbi:hypothetical protein AUC43_07345 [Hymenobacter sedentarius]|uniref:Uncharacterized protein n=1 Tax=Hymenobacter sedentarius TaxID=1411621 RepID=A0A0U4C9S2_9BACT|nr:hypothetical protein [Hymenobacter sedentarius]ALW84921.1 hypothetical protein AUC43_07345 [Hymenobacter sedentarius]
MKHSYYLFAVFLVACWQPARAQMARDQAEAQRIYQQANNAAAAHTLRASLRQATGFLGDGTFQFGTVRTYDGRCRPVPGLRFHAGLQLLETQDSVEIDSTHLWPAGSLRGFDLGEAGDAEMPLRRFRSRTVKEGSAGTRREFVEVLTTIDAGPMLLGWLYTVAPVPTPNGRRPLVATLLAGPGMNGSEPLRPLEPTQAGVLRLFGTRTEEVRTFATTQHLDYTRPADIARMMDYYNRIAVVK